MLAFADLLLDFRPAPAPALPARISRSVDTECRAPGWRMTTQVHRDRKRPPLAKAGTRQWTAWAAGEIYRYQDAPGDTAGCLASFLLDLERGAERPEHLAGRFVVAAWNQSRREWSVWTDRAGSVHVYYTSGGGGPVLGTYSPAVYAASHRRLDWAALSGFFAYGFFPEDRTHLDGVQVLRPATRYDFDSQGRLLRQQAYWKWKHEPAAGDAGAKLREFAVLMGDVLKDQTRDGMIALPLSGGLDSRTVAACVEPGIPLVAYSYGYADTSPETRIAAKIARARNLSFKSHTIRPYLFDRLDSVLMATEGFQDLTQARQADVADWLKDQSEFVLAAHWGDVFCDDMGLAGLNGSAGPDLAFNHLLRRLEKRGRNWLLENLCRPNLNGESPERVARGLIRREFDRLEDIGEADFRIKAVKTNQWAYRWTLASLRMYQEAVYPRMPFFDPRVMDYFCTVPTSMVRSRQLQIEFLKQFAPDLARIEWQVYDADLFHYRAYNTWLLPKRIFRKLSRMVTGDGAVQRNWEVQFFSPGQWERLECRLLWERSALHDLVSRSAIRGLLDRFHAERSPVDGYTVSMLLTFAAWLDKFGAARP